MGRYSLRPRSAASTPPLKKAEILKKTAVKATPIVPSKKTSVKKAIPEEKVRLDYLVVEKCVAHIHQRFFDDFVQETVSRQFAIALKSVHGRTSLLMKIDYFLNEIELQNVVPKRLLIHKDAVPFKVIIKLQADNDKHLKTVLTKLFDRFKRIKRLTIHNFKKSALTKLTNVIRKADGVRFRQLDIKTNVVSSPFVIINHQPSNFRDTSQLLLYIAPQIKELQLEGDFSIGPASSKRFWNAISTCSSLRHLNIIDVESFDNNYSKYDLLNCLKELKIKRFHANGLGLFFDSAAAMLSALGSNENLQYLWTNGGPTICSSPLLQPILNRLRYLRIDAVVNDIFAENDRFEREMLSILEAMPNYGRLCIRLMIFDEDTDENMLNIFKIFLQLSNTAKKPIDLLFRHLFPELLRFPTADEVADFVEDYLVETDDHYRNLFVTRNGTTYIFQLNSAKVKMSVTNE